ncbi:polycystin-1-like protein 2 [Branchiostoma floridae x Branchiostoma belcheri]
METIADAFVQTVSAAINMLPKQKTQTASDSDSTVENDLIDTSATDLSPRQQLMVLKEKKKEKEDMQGEASQSIVASLGQVADTLLALLPEEVEYQSSFRTGNVALDVARFPSDKDLHIGSGDIVAYFTPINRTNAQDMLDIKPGSRSSHVTTKSPNTAEENTNGTTMTYHAFNVPADNVIPVIRMSWWDVEATFHVYISYGSPPTPEKYGEKIVIKEDGYEAWLKGTDVSASFIPNTTDHGRPLYVGVQKLGPAISAQSRQPQPTIQILSRKDYTLSVSAVGCSSWNDVTNRWGLEDCDADINLEDGVISCRCPMTEWKVSVGTMTLPLPNSINFINAFQNFLHLSDNSVVFSIVVSEVILYLHIMVLLCVDFHQVRKALRRAFTRRVSPITGGSGGAMNQSEPLCKVSLVPPDRMVARHVYQLTVTTGSMFGAGTTSRIGFQLFGSEATSPVKMLNPKGEALLRGSTLHFVMPVRESLGEVLLLRIWHDNSGEGDTASWFLGSFVVRHMETDVVSYFICNDWLSREKGDGEVQKVVHASTKDELTSFTNVFNEATRDVFYDKQLWASALVAAPGSLFTKAQRLSCCFTLLNTMMLSSAMWYKAENTTADTRVLNLGFVLFTIQELYISLMTVLTVLPVNLVLLQLFRMEAPLSVNTPEISIRPSKKGYWKRTFFRLAKYVAWLTVFLVSTSSKFFVLLYSMDWGKEKSDAWMKAFVLSFMGSSCVMDSLQIFVLAVGLAAIFSLPFLTKPQVILKEDLQLNLWNSTAPKKVYPPAMSDVKSARKKKELNKKSASVLKEFLLLFIFVVLLFYIAQADKDQHAFDETQSLANNILQEYDAIKTPDQFYAWTEDVLLPTLYPTTWYNGRDMKYLDRQFAHNTGSFRLGPPRLTQFRQRPGSKSVDDIGWSVSGNCWRFNFTDVLPHPNDTKSLTITVNLYNPSLKLFSVVNMVLNRSKVGHLVPTATSTSFRLFQYESDADYVDLFMHILFTLLFFAIFCNELKVMIKMGWKYFTSKWNALGCVSLIGTATTISVFIKRYVVASETLAVVAKSNGDLGFERFVDLQTTAWWDACFKHILGLVVFINTISLLRVVRFSQTIGKLLALPGIMKEELLSFLVVAAIAFIAFISSAHLIFGSHMESYADLYHTTFALFEMMLGRFFAKDMLDSNPLTGPIFFSSFMICIFILLMNFLTTIICDAISTHVDVSHDQELGEYIWRRFRAMLGFHSTPDMENKQGELMMKGFEANIVIIQEKLDEGLDICNSILPSRKQMASDKINRER